MVLTTEPTSAASVCAAKPLGANKSAPMLLSQQWEYHTSTVPANSASSPANNKWMLVPGPRHEKPPKINNSENKNNSGHLAVSVENEGQPKLRPVRHQHPEPELTVRPILHPLRPRADHILGQTHARHAQHHVHRGDVASTSFRGALG